jgi:hypothetical protein
MNTESIRSLFVVSLPRSLSSVLYHAARNSLALEEPTWTSDGEILNADRFVLIPGPNSDMSRKFTTDLSEYALYRRIFAFLDQIVVSHGFAYKDVVQPFVVGEWLRRNRPPTLKVRRNVADVAYSMLEHQWYYPQRLFPKTKPLELGVVQGLLQAQEALDAIPGVEIDFDEVISDEAVLQSALTSLYGTDGVTREPKYVDRRFRRRREEILERRSSPRYELILEHIDRVRG